MKNLARQLLSCQEVERIQKAVAQVEEVTSGEVLPVIRSSCGNYRDSVLLGVLLSQGVYSLVWVLGVLLKNPPLSSFEFGAFLLGFLVLTLGAVALPHVFPSLLRKMVSRKRLEDTVAEKAFSAFVRYGVSGTKERSGILIFIALFERQVIILADKGINDEVERSFWQQVSDSIAKGMKEGRAVEAIEEAIVSCRDRLAHHFPPSETNPNELPDLIME